MNIGSYGYANATAPNRQVSTATAKPTPMHDKYISKGIKMPTEEVLDNRSEFFDENNRHTMPAGNSLADYGRIFQYGNNPYMHYVDNLPGNLKEGEKPGGGHDAFREISRAANLDPFQRQALVSLLEKNNEDYTNRVIQDMRKSGPEEAFRKYVMAGRAGGKAGYALQDDKIPDTMRDTRGMQQPLSAVPSNIPGQETQGVVEKHASVPSAAAPRPSTTPNAVSFGYTGLDPRTWEGRATWQRDRLDAMYLKMEELQRKMDDMPAWEKRSSTMLGGPSQKYVQAVKEYKKIETEFWREFKRPVEVMEILEPTPSPTPMPTQKPMPYPTATPSPQLTPHITDIQIITPKPKEDYSNPEYCEKLIREDEELLDFTATVIGEIFEIARGQKEEKKELTSAIGVANLIMNRKRSNAGRYADMSTVMEVTKDGFGGAGGDQAEAFRAYMKGDMATVERFTKNDGRYIAKKIIPLYHDIMAAILPVYYGLVPDITNGAIYMLSPNRQINNGDTIPERANDKKDAGVPGLDDYDLKFYYE